MNASARYMLNGFLLRAGIFVAEQGGVSSAQILFAVRQRLTATEKAGLLAANQTGKDAFTRLLVDLRFPIRDSEKLRLATQLAIAALSWDHELDTYLAA